MDWLDRACLWVGRVVLLLGAFGFLVLLQTGLMVQMQCIEKEIRYGDD
jgi:hypothetical protein